MVINVNESKLLFHGSALRMIPEAGEKELEVIGVFLMTTIVSAQRKEVITAWKKRCIEINFNPEVCEAVANSIGR